MTFSNFLKSAQSISCHIKTKADGYCTTVGLMMQLLRIGNKAGCCFLFLRFQKPASSESVRLCVPVLFALRCQDQTSLVRQVATPVRSL